MSDKIKITLIISATVFATVSTIAWAAALSSIFSAPPTKTDLIGRCMMRETASQQICIKDVLGAFQKDAQQ